MGRVDLGRPSNFINRHLSWMAFNRRVLEEALDENNPLLERVRFLAITASNLDEFVEIRVAALLQQSENDSAQANPDGLGARAQLDLLTKELHSFVEEQYRCWNQKLLPALAKEGIRVLQFSSLGPAAKDAIDLFYTRQVDPLLTPITIDPAHPFPHVINKALCVSFSLRRHRHLSANYLAVVTVPRKLPRLVRIPDTSDRIDFVFLHDIVEAHSRNLYRGYEVASAGAFRATRNSNLYLHEEESRNLLDTVDSQLHNRRRGDVVRLEIEIGASEEITAFLREHFGLRPWQVFKVAGPVNLSRLFSLADQTARPDLKFPIFQPRTFSLSPKSSNLFEEIREGDVLLHHPYDSYLPVISFLESAARDPNVLSIKQTLYRTSEDSPIVQALIEAAQTKEVTVVVELKARFDEASNIRWAHSMEEAGVQVFHGLVGLKTHCKLALVARSDPDGVIRRYAHLGTGNYNPSTARFYTDLSLLTDNPEITSAVHSVFNFLTARSEQTSYRPLLVSPVNLAAGVIGLIDREGAHARRKRPARIIAKMNALLDKPIIQALYRASRAGVEIDLIVRGACALRPGQKGLSDNIRVRSVVGRFLEHSRIFYFENAGSPETYLGSADWMPRNLYERVEVMFPLFHSDLRKRVHDDILLPCLKDTSKARILGSDGQYSRPFRHRANGARGNHRFSVQEFLMKSA